MTTWYSKKLIYCHCFSFWRHNVYQPSQHLKLHAHVSVVFVLSPSPQCQNIGLGGGAYIFVSSWCSLSTTCIFTLAATQSFPCRNPATTGFPNITPCMSPKAGPSSAKSASLQRWRSELAARLLGDWEFSKWVFPKIGGTPPKVDGL